MTRGRRTEKKESSFQGIHPSVSGDSVFPLNSFTAPFFFDTVSVCELRSQTRGAELLSHALGLQTRVASAFEELVSPRSTWESSCASGELSQMGFMHGLDCTCSMMGRASLPPPGWKEEVSGAFSRTVCCIHQAGRSQRSVPDVSLMPVVCALRHYPHFKMITCTITKQNTKNLDTGSKLQDILSFDKMSIFLLLFALRNMLVFSPRPFRCLRNHR